MATRVIEMQQTVMRGMDKKARWLLEVALNHGMGIRASSMATEGCCSCCKNALVLFAAFCLRLVRLFKLPRSDRTHGSFGASGFLFLCYHFAAPDC